MSNVWETLSKIDCSDHTEEKNGLTYLSWAWAWGMLKSKYPSASFTKHIWHADTWLREDDDDIHRSGLPYTSDKSGYAYVMVTVKVEEESITEVFPVLDYRNKAVQCGNERTAGNSRNRNCQGMQDSGRLGVCKTHSQEATAPGKKHLKQFGCLQNA